MEKYKKEKEKQKKRVLEETGENGIRRLAWKGGGPQGRSKSTKGEEKYRMVTLGLLINKVRERREVISHRYIQTFPKKKRHKE